MVVVSAFILFAVASFSALVRAQGGAAPWPTKPVGDVIDAGSDCTISWLKGSDSVWSEMSLNLMTGPNLNMVFMMVIATNLNGNANGSFTFKCPEVDINAPIYFIQFNSSQPDVTKVSPVWTTRFTIASDKGQTVSAPNTTQPDGSDSPPAWGVGHLVGTSSSSSTTSTPTNSPTKSSNTSVSTSVSTSSGTPSSSGSNSGGSNGGGGSNSGASSAEPTVTSTSTISVTTTATRFTTMYSFATVTVTPNAVTTTTTVSASPSVVTVIPSAVTTTVSANAGVATATSTVTTTSTTTVTAGGSSTTTSTASSSNPTTNPNTKAATVPAKNAAFRQADISGMYLVAFAIGSATAFFLV